jgi:hypothetical protein
MFARRVSGRWTISAKIAAGRRGDEDGFADFGPEQGGLEVLAQLEFIGRERAGKRVLRRRRGGR